MDQAPSTSQPKRKYTEYHDPDYPSEVAHSDDDEVTSKRPKLADTTKSLPLDKTAKTDANIDDGAKIKRRQILCNIISREFDTEIALKKSQLEQIDKRLDEALDIFNKLRYSIVSDYYRKQEVPLNKPAADAIRSGSQSLFSDESAGPQLQLHPSLKKIIGKKPKSYEDLLRTKPERSAAVQAKLEIRARNPAQKRHERRMQRLIRQQGIVIDHSKDEGRNSTSIKINLKPQDDYNYDDDDQPSTSKQALQRVKAAAAASATSSTSLISNPIQTVTTTTAISGKVLNTSRLNNKTKFLFVIGNTSKYIGAGAEADSSVNSQVLSHKWLVYVQGKDMQKPVETYLKKVRFYLHHSYRPNDVADVCHPPFQIARRGWGEFPMRIQLYFHEDLNQKPVQLLHNLILDKTLSGLHTLGAETVVEVWLRTALAKLQETETSSPATSSSSTCAISNTKPCNTPPKLPSPIIESNKPRTISITHNKEELDDTLFAFLNKIEMSPDIEKIQPTVVVPEQLECKLSISPIKTMPDNSTYIQQQIHTTITAAPPPPPPQSSPTNRVKVTNINVPTPSSFDTVKSPVRTVPIKPIVPKLTTTASATKPAVVYLPKTSNVAPPLRSNNNNNKITNSNLVVINDKKFIVTNANNAQLKANGSSFTSNSNNNKLVRFVDGQGRVKIVPMLLSQSQLQVPKPQTTNITKNVGNQLRATQTSLVPLKLDIKRAGPAKPSVFQKEGKLYIIDPQQMKLKQAQKKQQSLLKPQQSLLKQNQTQAQLELASRLYSIASDHDYAPAPISMMLRKPPPHRVLPAVTSSNINVPSVKLPKLKSSIEPTTDNKRLIIHRERLQLERQFQRVNFHCMREATEFLLRRLPIVAEKGTQAATFSYVRHSLREFEMLDGFKQRATEWIRAKAVQRFLRNHRRLKDFETSNKESYWSMREIIMFARYHAYTPIIKPINELENTVGNNTKLNQNMSPFAALVQSELKQEKEQIQYETLTLSSRLRAWVDLNTQRLQHFECNLIDNQIIDIDSIDEVAKKPLRKSNLFQSQLKPEEFTSNKTNHLYLPLPKHLSNAAQLVGDFCKSSGTQLETTEELTPGVLHTSTLTVLTHTLQLFVEKLLRRSIAAKLEHQQSNNEIGSDTLHLGAPSDLVINPQDIGRVIAQFTEYDFLTNSHLGITTNPDEVNP